MRSTGCFEERRNKLEDEKVNVDIIAEHQRIRLEGKMIANKSAYENRVIDDEPKRNGLNYKRVVGDENNGNHATEKASGWWWWCFG